MGMTLLHESHFNKGLVLLKKKKTENVTYKGQVKRCHSVFTSHWSFPQMGKQV